MSELRQHDTMVMLASQQLWPNIHGIVHWHKPENGGPLRNVCIYYTDERSVSAEPARRLQRFCTEYDPQIQVHLPADPCHPTAAGVREQLARWRDAVPANAWIVNATGGNKLMFAGALEAARLPNTTVVYREFGQDQWLRLTDHDGVLQAEELSISPEETDAIPVEQLIAAQWQPPQDTRWALSTPEPLDVVRLVQAGIEYDWAWNKVFAAAGYEQVAEEKRGFLFERFIGAVLLEMGISNLRCNVTLCGTTGNLHEIDLIANHRGRLLVFDCKTQNQGQLHKGNAEGITSQIRQAETTCRELLGLGAQGVLLRPCLELTDDTQRLAKAYRLSVIDLSDSRRMLSELAKFVGLRGLPPVLERCERLVDAHSRRSGDATAFCQLGYRARPRREPDGCPLAVFDVEHRLHEHMRSLDQDWFAYYAKANVVGSTEHRIYVHAANPQSLTENQVRHRLDTVLNPHGSVDECAKSKGHCNLTIKHKSGRRKHIEERLEQFLGKSLLGS